MLNKILSLVSKPLGSKIAWLGGSLATITAILSACGFLVIRSHQNLLGIADLVPNYAESWTVEGARFVYNSLFYLLGALYSSGWMLLAALLCLLLLIVMKNPQWMTSIQAKTTSSRVKIILIVVTFIGVIGLVVLSFKHAAVSHLLVEHQTFDNQLVLRGTEEGIEQLRIQYTLLIAYLLLILLWLRLLPRLLHFSEEETTITPPSDETAAAPRFSHWQLPLLLCWVFFAIPVFYLPLNYGKMVQSNTFFKVRLIKDVKTQTADYEGWLLHKDANEVVIYTGTPANNPIQIFKRGEFARVDIVERGNIFSP